MPQPRTPAPRASAQRRGEERSLTGELQFLLIACVLVLMLLLAGVPGRLPEAGDGSAALQQGWADRHAASVAAGAAGADIEALPGEVTPDGQLSEQGLQDAGLDRSAPQR
jgi:hypothetical protein